MKAEKSRPARRMFRGEPASPGRGAAPVLIRRPLRLEILERQRLPADDPDLECDRFLGALHESLDELRGIITISGLPPDVCSIVSAQRTILEDPGFRGWIMAKIHKERTNVEHVLALEIRQVEKSLTRSGVVPVTERFQDFRDAYSRILRNLLSIGHLQTADVRRVHNPFLIAAEDLLPSDLAILDRSAIKGIALEQGGPDSHSILIARALNIPAVIRIPGLLNRIRNGDPLLVDGDRGTVVFLERRFGEGQKRRPDCD